MSWLFSRAWVEDCLPHTPLASEPSVPSKSTPSAKACYSQGKMKGSCRLSRFGMTCEPLTVASGEAMLTSFRAGFLVKTSLPQEEELACEEKSPASGGRWPELLRKCSPPLCSLKTAPFSEGEDSPRSWPSLPIKGSMRIGLVWEHGKSVRPTKGIGSGSLPPLVRYPTPTCEDSTGRWYHNQRDGSIRLSLVGDCYQREGKLMLPTPTAHDAKEITITPGLKARASRKGSVHLNLPLFLAKAGERGRLNPRFVEWLMGMPEGWTIVHPYAPLETAKFHKWLDGLSWSFLEDLEEWRE